MFTTELLYLNDSYLKETQAKVLSYKDSQLILDKTIFYPGGGGLEKDDGIILNSRNFGVEIKDLKKDGNIIIHFVDGEFKEGETVILRLNWEKRYRIMRLHTAAHVISSLFYKKFNALITGNHIAAEKARVDLNLKDFSRELVEEVFKEANEIFKQDIELKIYYLPREEALKIPEIVKLAKKMPPSIETWRIVEIPGIDIQADGGVHVKNVNEVKEVQLLKTENKGKNNRRIYFTLND